MQKLIDITKDFSNKKILVIGDIMADKYLWGEVDRISPEAPIQVVKVKDETLTPGGAANLANNVVAMGGQAIMIGCIGKDASGKQLTESLKSKKIDCGGIVVNENKQTVTKVRVLGQNQQLMRLDYEDTTFVDEKIERSLLDNIKKLIKKCDVVVISDYFKGTVTEKIIKSTIKLAKQAQKISIADVKAYNFKLYRGIDLVTPNHKEASEMTGITGASESDIRDMGQIISNRLGSNVLITRAAEGMSLIKKGSKLLNFPTEAKEVYDVSGAGDTVVAALSLALAADTSYEDAVLIANQAAAIQVSKLGTAAVDQKELQKRFEAEYTKVRDRKEISQIIKKYQGDNKKVVFTSGCFDLLHPGHIKYLKKASELGDILVIGLNTDDSIKKIKGNGRPVVGEEQRAEMLSFLDFVDLVTFFSEDTPAGIISYLEPDVFVKGGDYQLKDLPEAEVVKSYGGEVVLVPFIEGFSSSKIIDKIKNSPN